MRCTVSQCSSCDSEDVCSSCFADSNGHPYIPVSDGSACVACLDERCVPCEIDGGECSICDEAHVCTTCSDGPNG